MLVSRIKYCTSCNSANKSPKKAVNVINIHEGKTVRERAGEGYPKHVLATSLQEELHLWWIWMSKNWKHTHTHILDRGNVIGIWFHTPHYIVRPTLVQNTRGRHRQFGTALPPVPFFHLKVISFSPVIHILLQGPHEIQTQISLTLVAPQLAISTLITL